MIRGIIIILFSTLVALRLMAFVPGGENVFLNVSAGTIGIAYKSTAKDFNKSMGLARGSSLNLSDDHGEILWIRVTYPNHRSINLGKSDIDRKQRQSGVCDGVWLITDSDIEFVCAQAAARFRRNIRR